MNSANTSPIRFGAFFSPLHSSLEDPTMALHRDIDLIAHLDELGFDEVWMGEHHSSGWEFVSSPEVMLAYAAARTKRIRLGTGVVSLPYHNPFTTAQRMILLDHLARGRIMFGVGPGALAEDMQMLGLDPMETRGRMEQSLEVILDLMDGKRVTRDEGWFKLVDAHLQLPPYSRAGMEIAVSSTASPSGARLAGRFGTSLLSFGATADKVGPLLRGQWQIAEEQAALHGTTVSRENWRLVGPMHIAPTEEQARREVAYGIAGWADYMTKVTPLKVAPPGVTEAEDIADALVKSGFAVIGTPDQAIARLNQLIDATGGFGSFLLWTHDWADRDGTFRSMELFKRHVVPAFERHTRSLYAAEEQARTKAAEAAAIVSAAREKASQDYVKSKPNRDAAA